MSAEDAREGFLARWSRRKRAAREGAPEEPPSAPEAAASSPVTSTADPQPAAKTRGEGEEIDLSFLPKIEDITPETDLRPFFAKGVPVALREAALARMWSVDPKIRDFVGPADYAWDFNAPGGVPGFSLDLPEEAKALAKRLLGIDREEEEKRQQAGTSATESAVEGAGEQGQQQAVAAGTEPAGPPPAFVPPALLPAEPPEAAAEANATPPPPPRRRHGSALPV
jgi:hypothetical protein